MKQHPRHSRAYTLSTIHDTEAHVEWAALTRRPHDSDTQESAGPCAKSYPLIVSSCPSSNPACHPAPGEPCSKSSPSHHRSSAWQGLEASHVPALSHGRAVSVSGADPAAQTAARAHPRFVALPPRPHERTSSHLPGPRGRRARLRGVHIGCPILLAGDACQPRAHTSSLKCQASRNALDKHGIIWSPACGKCWGTPHPPTREKVG